MKHYLIEIRHADVSLNGEKVLRDISWKLGEGEHWAVIGPNGSGKSTFLKLVRGDLWPEPLDDQKRLYRLDAEEQETPVGMKKYISMVTPELYHFYLRHDLNLKVDEVVYSGFSGTVWLQDKPSRQMRDRAGRIMDLTGAGDLQGRNLLELSQGEARKVLIARAIVSNPRILLLDEICDGLDAPSRREVLRFLDQIAQEGTQIVYATHRLSELVASTTHVMIMKGGKIVEKGSCDAVAVRDNAAGPQDGQRVLPRTVSFRRKKGRRLLRVKDATVYLGERKVLDNISWEVRSDENWAVIGRNGSGKTSLLRLAAGSLHPALGGTVERFGGKKVSVWEDRRRSGYVSAELQAGYDEDLTGEEVVQSGFFSSIGLYTRVSAEQKKKSRTVIKSLGLGALAGKKIGEMSYGEFRKILIARAMVNSPEVLLLDEPFNGLDASAKKEFRGFLEDLCQRGTAVILVIHHLDEIIPSITHAMIIEKGRIAAQGRKEDVLSAGLLSI